MILKSLWYFAYLNYSMEIMITSSFLNCSLTKNVTTEYSCRDIKMLGMNCSLQLWKKIIQIYLKTLMTSKITWGGFFFWNTRYIYYILNIILYIYHIKYIMYFSEVNIKSHNILLKKLQLYNYTLKSCQSSWS